jgi:hypothetical protein
MYKVISDEIKMKIIDGDINYDKVEEKMQRFNNDKIVARIISDPLYCAIIKDGEYKFSWFENGEKIVTVNNGYFYTASGNQLKTLMISVGLKTNPVTSIANIYYRPVEIDDAIIFIKTDDATKLYNLLFKDVL